MLDLAADHVDAVEDGNQVGEHKPNKRRICQRLIRSITSTTNVRHLNEVPATRPAATRPSSAATRPQTTPSHPRRHQARDGHELSSDPEPSGGNPSKHQLDAAATRGNPPGLGGPVGDVGPLLVATERRAQPPASRRHLQFTRPLPKSHRAGVVRGDLPPHGSDRQRRHLRHRGKRLRRSSISSCGPGSATSAHATAALRP